MSGQGSLMHLTVPQEGKMRQVSSQGRQDPPEMMAKAIGVDEPGKSVRIKAGETYTVADVAGAGTILRIWMTIMQPLPGGAQNHNHSLVLKVRIDERENPSLPSVANLWQGADFQEREIYDLFGIRFEGHPNLKRIFLWEGFPGHPLLKGQV